MDNRKLLGLNGLLKGVGQIKYIKDIVLPLGIAICLSIMLMLGGKSPFTVLEKISNMTISITSTLLSFSLAGYTLLVGLNLISTLKPKVDQEEDENNKITLYEKINIVFSFYLLIQILTLLFSAIISILIVSPTSLSEPFPDIINYIGIVIFLVLFFYELLLLKDLVIIIYNYSLFQKHRKEDNNKE